MEFVITEAHVENFKKLGVYYGYPKCCVEEFISDFRRKPKRKFYGTGFVPCIKCNEKSGKELLREIAANRVCPKAFPREVT